MLIFIDEDSFTEEASPASSVALERAISSSQWGFSRLVVSPRAIAAAENARFSADLLAALRVAQAAWLEGQSLLPHMDRIVFLVDRHELDGQLHGNRFLVSMETVIQSGVLSPPALITESMEADGKLLRLYLDLWLEKQGLDLQRVWYSRLEQGGGDSISTYVQRFMDDPSPMLIVCDRDKPTEAECGVTARNCYRATIGANLFPDRDAAVAGGFSPTHAHFAFQILRARSIENLIFPEVARLFFDELMSDAPGRLRQASLLAEFPTLPVLNDSESQRWLFAHFRRFERLGDNPVFTSNDIRRLVSWAESSADNRSLLREAFFVDMENGRFADVMTVVFRAMFSLGVRDYRLT